MEITQLASMKPDVLLRLTASEATLFRRLFGAMGRSDIEKVIGGQGKDEVGEANQLLYNIYDQLEDLGY